MVFEILQYVKYKLYDIWAFIVVFSRIICLTQLHVCGMSEMPVTTTMVALICLSDFKTNTSCKDACSQGAQNRHRTMALLCFAYLALHYLLSYWKSCRVMF